MGKVDYMCVEGDQKNLILLNNGRILKNRSQYKYYGQKITNNGTLDESTRGKNTLGTSAVLWGRKISKDIKGYQRTYTYLKR